VPFRDTALLLPDWQSFRAKLLFDTNTDAKSNPFAQTM